MQWFRGGYEFGVGIHYVLRMMADRALWRWVLVSARWRFVAGIPVRPPLVCHSYDKFT